MNLKKRLKKRDLIIGSWITIGNAVVAEIMAKAGCDWLTVDMEHSAITLDIAQDLIRVIELCGVVPFVRVGENEPNLIKRVMDADAHGVIVPMVNSRADAEKAVASVNIRRRAFAVWDLPGHRSVEQIFEEYNRPWIIANGNCVKGEKVVEVGGAYSGLPQYLSDEFDVEALVTDDFGVESKEDLWFRWGAREELKSKYPSVNYVFERVGGGTTNIPSDYFDCVYTVSTLEHIPPCNMKKVFVQMCNMLKLGGRMLHCVDVPIPLGVHKSFDLKGIFLGTVGYSFIWLWCTLNLNSPRTILSVLNLNYPNLEVHNNRGLFNR